MRVIVATRRYENALRKEGYSVIAGVDEVGRGPAAGPVVVAAVVLREKSRLSGVRDSKLLSAPKREMLAKLIRKEAVAVGLGWSHHDYIDANGLTLALQQAARQALGQLPPTDIAVLDGAHNYLTSLCHSRAVAKADRKCISVAAASIIAKVARDQYMELINDRYPEYGFGDHKGYLTPSHIQVLKRLGPSPVHRLRWGSLGEYAVNL